MAGRKSKETPATGAGVYEFVPHPHQDRAIASERRFIACVSGVQGGKTTVGAVWLLREIYKFFEAKNLGDFLIAAPTVKVLQQSTLPKFKEFFNRTGWGVWKEAKGCFELKAMGMSPGGEPYKIYVRSTEEPDLLEGMTVKAAWLDEVGQMKDAVWTNVQGRLAIAQGRCIMTTTPYAPNWFWRDIMRKAGTINGVVQEDPDANPDVDMVTWRSVDNPAFPKAEYDRAKATMSKALFERRYEGKPTMLEGLVYEEINDDCFVKPFAVPQDWVKFAGVDFGHSDPNVILKIAIKPAKAATEKTAAEPAVFYVYEEFYKRGALLHEMAASLQKEPLEFILADPSAAQEIAELSRFHGVKRIQSADNTQDVGIERVRLLIHEGRLRFFRGRCENAIREVLSYHYPAPNEDRKVQDKPVGVNDHAMDALRYAFSRPNVEGLYAARERRVVRQDKRNPFAWGDETETFAGDRFTGYTL